MKKKLRYLFLFLLIAMLGFSMSVHADSGWDGSYDSGGSSWGSSGSSWSSSGSSWSSSDSSWSSSDWSSSGSSSGGSVGGFVMAVVIIIVVIYFVSVASQNRGTPNHTSSKSSNNYSIVPYDIAKITEVLPGFSKEEFRVQAYKIYKDIQIAWMEFDYDTLRKYTTDELYNQYHSQLVALNLKKQKNIMKDFELNDFEIVGMEKTQNSVALKVRMIVECRDYVVDNNNKVVRGSDAVKLIYDYEMTFIIGLGEKDNHCPNCNAPLENNNSTVCPYCGSTIISDKHDWVLSKKQMMNQRRK